MRDLPDNNADGHDGTIPYIYIYIYIYLDFCRFLVCGCGVESFDVCIIFVQIRVELVE